MLSHGLSYGEGAQGASSDHKTQILFYLCRGWLLKQCVCLHVCVCVLRVITHVSGLVRFLRSYLTEATVRVLEV